MQTDGGRIMDLIELTYNAQKERDKQEAIIAEAKDKIASLEADINSYKNELLELITDYDPFIGADDNMLAVRMARKATGYKDEKGLIEFLKNNYEGKFIKSKVTESLDKVPLKKELKTNAQLSKDVEPFIENSRNIMYCVRNANEIRKIDEETERRRKTFITKAIVFANNLYVDIQTNLEFIPKSLEKYTELLEELEKLINLLKRWS